MKTPQILGIIPARGGSKSIPNKNIIDLHGKPLIAHTINVGKNTPSINRLIVSTDSTEIADVSSKYGAEIPFIRPSYLAEDDTPDLPVFIHCLEWLIENDNYMPDLIVQLRPTNPFRKSLVIESCIQKMIKNPKADALRVVTPSTVHPYKMWVVDEDQQYLGPLIKSDISEPYNLPRQSLPETFQSFGYVDVIRPDTILKKRSMTGQHILSHILKDVIVMDIDDWQDLEFARFLADKHLTEDYN
ncbi:MAG: acylneuraminate cytidylyltransferase family protein [SAR202 cluster bacterium]|nr:acylneuraminate cytidylyltransferase family protein [SAR202 cluster bacterium]|tara:strand:- start:416 stop:1147 length:732 start_codon:yes stop_codon:yes gene_type:complete